MYQEEKREITVTISRPALTALVLVTEYLHEDASAVIERLIRAEGARVAEVVERETIERTHLMSRWNER